MLIHAVGSRNVYENKRKMDKMTANKSDIYGNMTRILHKNSGYDGAIHLDCRFKRDFWRIFVPDGPRSRAERSAYSVSTAKRGGLLPHGVINGGQNRVRGLDLALGIEGREVEI